MPNRIIKESICTSENLNGLSFQEEVFFYRLIVNCDDFGRFDARPSVLRARLFPLRLGAVTEKQVTGWLLALISHSLVYVYESGEMQYLQITTWEKHQQRRASKSKFPEPPSNGNQLLADDIRFPRNRESIHDTRESIIDTRAKALKESFVLFWNAYPRKKSRSEAEKAFLRLSPDEQLLAVIMAKIEQAKTSDDWIKDEGKFIPYPATWLNGKRWEDEIKPGGNGNGHRTPQGHSQPDHELTEDELNQKWGVGVPLT